LVVAKRKPAKARSDGGAPRTRRLSDTQQQIFSVIRKLANAGEAPSILRIREKLPRIDSRTLRYNLKALERLGYVRSIGTHGLVRYHLGERAKDETQLWKLVDDGFAEWNGGRPRGSTKPVKIIPGPPVSDYVIEDRG
jgi:DNA-binding HxlR family transcriptional regulator